MCRTGGPRCDGSGRRRAAENNTADTARERAEAEEDAERYRARAEELDRASAAGVSVTALLTEEKHARDVQLADEIAERWAASNREETADW